MASSGGKSKLKRFEGKVAIVTGATAGIGLAIAERLGQEGASLVICSRKQKNVDTAVQHLKQLGIRHVIGLALHVGTDAARGQLIDETVKAFGRIDVLVSNVANNPVMGPMMDVTTEDVWSKIMDINVKSHFFLVKSALPHMSKGSSVVFVSSYAGYIGNPLLGVYSVSNTALLGLTRVLSRELAPSGVRVNCIAPGIIKTKFSEALWKADEVGEIALKDIPMNRFGSPDECAGVVAFLASDDASYVTGETVVAAGGIPARL